MGATRVGIAGLGAIGRVLARKIHEGAVPGLIFVGVASGDEAKARGFLAGIGADVPVLPMARLAREVELVIECAPAAAFPAIAEPVLDAGKTLLALSAGMLLRHPELIALARTRAARIIVPSGALLGLDALAAAAEGDIHSVRLTTRKPVKSLLGAPYLARHGIDIRDLGEALRIFSGSAREAALGFPENVNVAAALSLAGIGPDRTQVEIWADPALARNVHHIRVEADAANFDMSIENLPSENPRTSRITALSVLAALRRRAATLSVGS
jgi:aspartate dehydrogenase